MRKRIVAFRNFASAPKNASVDKTKFRRCLPFIAARRKSAVFVCRELQREGKILLDSLRYEYFKAGIKSLRATLPADMYYWGF
jgi:hypothetical protein